MTSKTGTPPTGGSNDPRDVPILRQLRLLLTSRYVERETLLNVGPRARAAETAFFLLVDSGAIEVKRRNGIDFYTLTPEGRLFCAVRQVTVRR